MIKLSKKLSGIIINVEDFDNCFQEILEFVGNEQFQQELMFPSGINLKNNNVGCN